MFYIVGTPIGNIEDTSLRAVKTLANADIILAEDTRTFKPFYSKVLSLFNISPKKSQQITSFHDQNEFDKVASVIDSLEKGRDIALVSESGMPTVSDPGNTLINQLMKARIFFTVVPGPTACMNAVVLSGVDAKNIFFIGFLPKKESQIVKLFEKLMRFGSEMDNISVVFYESPHRIIKTLQIIDKVLPNVEVSICREMTKKFEEVISGTARTLEKKSYKGELTVILFF